MDDEGFFPLITSELDWIASQHPEVLKQKEDLIHKQLMQVRRSLSLEVGKRRLNRIDHIDTYANTMTVRRLAREESELRELLTPNWSQESSYLMRVIQRLPREWQEHTYTKLSSLLGRTEAGEMPSPSMGRVQFRVSPAERSIIEASAGSLELSSWMRSVLDQLDLSMDGRAWPVPGKAAKLTEKLWCRIDRIRERELRQYCLRNRVPRSRVLRSAILAARR